MLKRITTAGVTLAALGAFALGGSVIASAKTHHASPNRHAIVAESLGTAADAPGGANVQSGDQTAPDTGTATAASEKSAETPSAEADGPGGPNVQSGSQTGGPDTGSATSEKSTPETSSEAPSAADGPGGPNVQAGGNTQQ